MKVLVLDDDEEAGHGMVMLLAACGLQACAVSDPQDAYVRAREWQPSAVVTDIFMPAQDGFHVAKRLRNEHPALRLLGFTAGDHPAMRELAADAGIERVYRKGSELLPLVDALSRTAGDLHVGHARSHPGDSLL